MGVRLTAEYQEVEYITGNSAKQYINTGIYANSDEIVIEAKVKPGPYAAYTALWGNYIDESHKVTRLIASNVDYAILSFINTIAGNGTNQIGKALFGKNTIFVIRQEKSKITIDGISYIPSAAGGGTANDTPIAINSPKINPTLTPATNDYPQSFYYFRILDGETALIDLVPCYRKSDDKPGMYDLVSGTFFTNAGTGEFLVGPDVIDSISPWLVARRRMLMRKPPLDTSPKIAEYGKYLTRSNTGTESNADWCYTIWYDIYPAPGTANRLQLVNCGIGEFRTYQYTTSAGGADWDYRKTGGYYYLSANANKIRVSIPIANLLTCYAYIESTGQILFAGKNTPYYGYTNINDMPTGT